MDVDEIRETTMDFRLHFYQNEYWRDPRLNLEVLNLTMTKVLPPSAESTLWIPDIVYDNSKWGELFQFSIPNTVIRISKDHTIMKTSRYSFRVACPMNLNLYPIDIQNCIFKIALIKNTVDKAVLQWSGTDDSPYKHYGPSIALMQDIQPLKHRMKLHKPYQAIECNYSFLYANFSFVRRLTGSIINVYVPSSIVVTLSWLSFWLDVNAVPARITLGVTAILTLITQVLQSRSYTPPVDYVKALDIWLFACTFFVSASLIEYAFAHQSGEYTRKVST
ncbi:glycine receptor subunit alphaZ1-like [Centruroides vittatus]|uniref:glycine receptor subunit alphaZ1-like n=1 Tax=Centruroides vittatus TaxID=120091 RepID=UPI00350EC802